MADVDKELEPLNEREDQIEVEDDLDDPLDTFLFDHETFIRKLREKPQFPAEPTDCGTAWPKKSYNNWSAPLADRLSTPTLSKIDYLKERIPYPLGCIPPLSLPSWHFLALEKRIPYLNAGRGLVYYTTGKLGKPLHRKTVTYSLKDPLNLERVVGAPYNSLHDPHAKALLFNPNFHDLIFRRGFVNERDEVLCSFKEFNKFRDYLRTLWCDEVWKEVESTDTFIKSERDQYFALMKAESETQAEGRAKKVADRIANAKRFQKELAEFKRKKQEQRDEINEARLRQWRLEKEREIVQKIMRGLERARQNRDRLRALYEMRLQMRRDIMSRTARKWLETEERRRNDKAMMQAAYNKFLLEWFESKYVFCYEKLIESKQLQRDINEARKYRAKRRQQRLEAYRKAMPSIQEKRKAETERVWAIVRKFAMRWLEKVRRRLNAPKDVKHESCWIGQSKGILDDTLKYLYQESGYEKLDDFILNIMKLKKQIQAQIEMEEAEEAAMEAAAAARASEEEEYEGPPPPSTSAVATAPPPEELED